MIVKDKELRDNPPVDFWTDHETERFDAERPELHDVLRRWRRIAEEYDPPRLLLGETYVAGADRLARFYGEGDELQLAFNFPFLKAPFHAEPLRALRGRDRRPPCRTGAWPVWTASNHDHSRFPTRWAQNDPGASASGCSCCSPCGARRCSTTATRSAWPTRRSPARSCEDPVGLPPLAGGARAATSARTPMQWQRRRRRRVHGARGRALAARSATPTR